MTALEFEGRRLACAPTLDLGAGFVDSKGGQAWLHGVFPDVFDPAFESFARRRAADLCKPRADDRFVLGWFTDNELRWGPDWRGKEELLSLFLDMPVGSRGRAAAVRLLRERHGDVAKFNAIWKTTFPGWEDLEKAPKIAPPYVRRELYLQNEGDERASNEKDPARAAFVADCEAFAGLVAEQYFRITRDAIRAADPHHLNFGCRFAYVPSRAVVEVSERYLDAISFNCYQVDPRKVIRAYAMFKKPLILGEFTFRSRDSGLPNTRGAGPHVDTQAERASAFARYVELALGEPEVVGYHWFQHNDQPREGRFDGEDSNYGIVDKDDEPWKDLTATMRSTNAKAEDLHRAPAKEPKAP
jgi:agarase